MGNPELETGGTTGSQPDTTPFLPLHSKGHRIQYWMGNLPQEWRETQSTTVWQEIRESVIMAAKVDICLSHYITDQKIPIFNRLFQTIVWGQIQGLPHKSASLADFQFVIVSGKIKRDYFVGKNLYEMLDKKTRDKIVKEAKRRTAIVKTKVEAGKFIGKAYKPQEFFRI